ncbi:nicotinate phosphoribosyltransferase [Acidaminobacter sp. JC074]|uniref:nicotinate phosphoribosyltransferase n=1 Tax=Acidaminobacter sp. JC074 TaxID=2530199 RepID=UPI001F0FBE72|nr:nicotinate phosphoribosyltransferase [Acidaminobacter sp. JC074]MCH4888470.1 nicotinate phosphoribosyltransferase [Acidaminobacter sp. JC074]
MTWYNKKRLSVDTFKMTDDIITKLRDGWYSDEYFNNTIRVLKMRANNKIEFGNYSHDLDKVVDVSDQVNGDVYVEMQFFTRRKPFSVVAGVDEALAILEVATGYYEGDKFINTFDQLEIEAVHDGTLAHYDGDPLNVDPVLIVRGRYRDFGHLETPILGVLSLPTRIATNTYNVLEAANGKPVLFFPARFDHYKIQAVGGYAYQVALERFNLEHRHSLSPFFSTGEQNDWWGSDRAKGTISHASIACFYGNTAMTMLAFAETIGTDTPRIALVDFHNDCIKTTYEVIDAMWERYFDLMKSGQEEEALKYVLYGVRPDTSGNMMDASIDPLYDKKQDNGVNLRLVRNLRSAMDTYYHTLIERMDEADKVKYKQLAKDYCRGIKITVTGGFNVKKIKYFEEAGAPVDSYGVGSSLLSNASSEGTNNDFTADIVKVKIDDVYYPLSKVGRGVCSNKHLIKIQ